MRILLSICLLIISLKVSSQSGIIWNPVVNISNNTFSNLHPRISLDANGNPLVIWGRINDESVFFSRWNGTMFTTPIKLNGTFTVAAASWMGADIASHGDTVYVVMKQTPEANIASHIYLVRSYNGGITFSSPLQVDNIADSISRFPTVTTDATGNPIVAFMKFNKSFSESRWVVTKSIDYGDTFSVDVKASGWGNSGEVCDCCPGGIVSDGNKTAMLYRDNNKNIRDTWMGVSTDYSASFSNGFNIDNNIWNLNACPSTGPDGIIIGDSLYAVFMNGASGSSKVYQSISTLSNSTFQSTQPLTADIPGISLQNYPRIAGDGNAVAVVWNQVEGGNDQLPILFTNDIENGFPVTYDMVDEDNITNADVELRNGNVFVVWEDDNSGTVKFRSGTFKPITTGIQENTSQDLFSISPNPASNSLNIQLITDDAKLIVTDLLGRQILSKHIQNNIQLNISDWTNGIYFITVQSGTLIFSQKFIKE